MVASLMKNECVARLRGFSRAWHLQQAYILCYDGPPPVVCRKDHCDWRSDRVGFSVVSRPMNSP